MNDAEARAREMALELALKYPAHTTIINRAILPSEVERAEKFRQFLMGETSAMTAKERHLDAPAVDRAA